jgi:hypothetical protein
MYATAAGAASRAAPCVSGSGTALREQAGDLTTQG